MLCRQCRTRLLRKTSAIGDSCHVRSLHRTFSDSKTTLIVHNDLFSAFLLSVLPPCRPSLLAPSPIRVTFDQYAALAAVGGGTSSFTIQSSTDFPYTSYFNKRTLTSWSRTTEATRTTTAPSGWVIGTETEIIWTVKASHEAIQCSLTARKDGRMSVLLFLTHYIRYYGIKTSDNLRVTSYCDSEKPLKNEESFHRDVDSSSWYLKSDHDVIMKLSSVRKDYHLNSSHDTSRVTKTTSEYDDLTRPEQLNVSRPPRPDALDELCGWKIWIIPAAEATCATVPGILPVAKSHAQNRIHRVRAPSVPSDATTGQTRSMIPSAGLLTDQPTTYLATVNGHLWSN
jgi:hypothetical protein